MDNSFDLMKIYGIPPARYNENEPIDLYYSNLPSLEQIASYNLALQNQGTNTTSTQVNMSPQGLPPVPQINQNMSTPTTTMGMDSNDITSILTPTGSQQSSASAELPQLSMGTSDVTQQITDFSRPYPVTAESIQYLNGFIRTQIGRRVQVDFLIGNNEILTKDGFLLGVGANYILLNEIGTNDITACDFYNIKFIRFLY